MRRWVVISGCSGGGKSTLLAGLAHRGYATVTEPGRRIVREEMDVGGSALPWLDIVAFLQRALALAVADRRSCRGTVTFFDRGFVDAALGLEHVTGVAAAKLVEPCLRYDPNVFLVLPWPEIFVTDAERRHGFGEAIAEYERLLAGFPKLGYRVTVLPKVSVSERAGIVLASLSR